MIKNAPSKEFVITRVFNAPRETVWKAWSEASRLAKWWGPKGTTIKVTKLDFCPGGIFHYSMTSPDDSKMWGRFIYRDIDAPNQIVFVNSFSDSSGGMTHHPGAEAWPLEMLCTVTFEKKNDSETLLTLRSSAINASDSEKKTFEEGFSSMQEGYGGTWDRLDVYLATL